MPVIPDSDYWTIEAMKTYGGSFVQALGRAAAAADPENLRRIKETWPKYWNQYTQMGKNLREKRIPKS